MGEGAERGPVGATPMLDERGDGPRDADMWAALQRIANGHPVVRLTVRELAAQTPCARSRAPRILSRLEAAGLVKVSRHPAGGLRIELVGDR